MLDSAKIISTNERIKESFNNSTEFTWILSTAYL